MVGVKLRPKLMLTYHQLSMIFEENGWFDIHVFIVKRRPFRPGPKSFMMFLVWYH